MKASQRAPGTTAVERPKRHAKVARSGLPNARISGKAAQSRAQQKTGSYKRVEVFLGLEAAIALRHLMRDGRSAREVIEALLLATRQRSQQKS
jgi:hypothetical protein